MILVGTVVCVSIGTLFIIAAVAVAVAVDVVIVLLI